MDTAETTWDTTLDTTGETTGETTTETTGETVTRIGILGYESKDYGDILGKCERTLIDFTKQAAKHNNVEVFYFCAGRVNIAEQTITGTFYDPDNDRFFDKQTPFPDSIFREPARRGDKIPDPLHSDSGELVMHRDSLTRDDKAVHKYLQKIIPCTHVKMGTKTEIYKVMEKHCPKYLIQTYDYTDEDIETHIDKHKVLILKPTASSGGKNVYKLSKNEEGSFTVQYDDIIQELDKKSFFDIYSKKFIGDSYIVQPYIRSWTNDGHPFDVRVNAFRGRDGRISNPHREIYVRKGAKGTLVSNVDRGGEYIGNYEDYLLSEFGAECEDILKGITDIAENLLYEVQKGYPGSFLGSAGFDVGINRANGNELKIFEINRSPHIPPIDPWMRHEVRFNYCLFMAEHNLNQLKQLASAGIESGPDETDGEADKKTETGYAPTKKAIAITFERTDSIDVTFNGSPVDEDSKPVWEIAETSVARIDERNIISAVGNGETRANAVIDGKIVASVPVYVERQPLPPIGDIAPSRFSIGSDGCYTNNNTGNKALLMFVGDVMFLSEQQRKCQTPDGSYNFNPSFEYVKPVLEQSDFAMGTLETILDSTYPYKWEQTKVDDGSGYMVPNCNAPVTCLDAIRYGGLDAVSTANNHCLDSGLRGLLATIGHLDRYNILRTGTFRDNEKRYLHVEINGLKVAVLAYSTYLNLMEELWRLSPPEKNTHTNHYIPGITETIVGQEVAELKKQGMDYIIVMLHSGLVNTPEPVGKVVDVCRDLANAGADYVINSHSHTLQSYSIISADDGRKVPVIYSMGNFVSSMDQVEDHRNRDAVILTIELEKENGRILMDDGYIPCYSRRSFRGGKYVTLPCDGYFNGGYKNATLDEARKRIRDTLGTSISEFDPRKLRRII